MKECLGKGGEEISIGTVQLMLLYWSLWPELINTKATGQQLGNHDSILTTMLRECMRALTCVCMCVCVCVCVCTLMSECKMSISTFRCFLCAAF